MMPQKNMKTERIPYAFQPIFEIGAMGSDKRIGYEALMRPEHKAPAAFLDLAVKQRDTHRLEFLTFYNAITQYAERNLDGMLFINSFPYEVLTPLEYRELYQIMPERLKGNIVVENLEYGDRINLLLLSNKVSHLRENGFLVALDDFGMGINSVDVLKLMQPDIVKIDRYYVAGCTKNAIARNTIEIVIESIRSNHSIVLAEGVETEEEYLFLKNHADVKYMQGFYLGIPE